jgi:hypothetical protein
MLARRTNLLPRSVAEQPQQTSVNQDQFSSQRAGKWHLMSNDQRASYVRQVWAAAPTIQEAADVVGCTAPTPSHRRAPARASAPQAGHCVGKAQVLGMKLSEAPAFLGVQRTIMTCKKSRQLGLIVARPAQRS